MDVLDSRFGFPCGSEAQPGKPTSIQRYNLLLGIPQAADRDRPPGENSSARTGFEVFRRLAQQL